MRAALLIGIPFGLIWLCTGGCVVHSYWLLPSDVHDSAFRPYVQAEVTSQDASYGIPFVFQYHTDQPPYRIRVTYITHSVVADPVLKLESLTVKFPDGSVMDLTDRFREGVVPAPDEHWYVDDDHLMQKRPSLRWETVIEDVLPRATAFELRMRGHLYSHGRPVEALDAVLHIRLRYETTTQTGWMWLASASV
jgi:hypothetical protein